MESDIVLYESGRSAPVCAYPVFLYSHMRIFGMEALKEPIIAFMEALKEPIVALKVVAWGISVTGSVE